MSAREELASAIACAIDDHTYRGEMIAAADAILAAGYRKMPDREALTAAIAEHQSCGACSDPLRPCGECQKDADFFLALMEGNDD